MNTTDAIPELILRIVEYTIRSVILRSVDRGKIASERAKPGTNRSSKKPKNIGILSNNNTAATIYSFLDSMIPVYGFYSSFPVYKIQLHANTAGTFLVMVYTQLVFL